MGGEGAPSISHQKKCPFLQDWDGEHEVAWGWLWENIEGLLSSMLGELFFFFWGGGGEEGWKDGIENHRKKVAITFKMGNCPLQKGKKYHDFFETDFVLLV